MTNLAQYFKNQAYYFESKNNDEKEEIAGSKIEPSEVLTACLVAANQNIFNSAVKKPIVSTIQAAVRLGANNVVGVGDLEKYIKKTSHYAGSLSAAIKIRNLVKDIKNYKIILSGRLKPSQASRSLQRILSYAPDKSRIKNYNSSDIVLQSKESIIGISLKKKKQPNQVDPTLINTPIHGWLNKILSPDQVKTLISARVDFFEKILSNHPKTSKDFNKSDYNEIPKKDLTARNEHLGKFVGQIDKEYEIRKKASGKKTEERPSLKLFRDQFIGTGNTYFKAIYDVLLKNEKKFVSLFLHDALRVGLKEINEKIPNFNFKFYLVTGIGSNEVKKNGEFVIHPATALSLNNVTHDKEGIERNFSSNDFKLIPHNIQAFSKESNKISLDYFIDYKNTHIFSLSIRYKGNYRSSPEFQLIPLKGFHDVFEHE